MEVVGEFLGRSQDAGLYAYFHQHYQHFFPGIGKAHRTTFVRQAANLWKVKEQVWQHLLDSIQHDPARSCTILPLLSWIAFLFEHVNSPELTVASDSEEKPEKPEKPPLERIL